VSLEVRPRYTSGSTHYLFPADWAAIYNLNPLYKAGTNGAGTSIAIVGRSNINLADVSAFRAAAGLPAGNPTVILVGKNPGLVAGIRTSPRWMSSGPALWLLRPRSNL